MTLRNSSQLSDGLSVLLLSFFPAFFYLFFYFYFYFLFLVTFLSLLNAPNTPIPCS